MAARWMSARAQNILFLFSEQALMAMPAPDFSLCLFLIPERVVRFSQVNFFFFVAVFLDLISYAHITRYLNNWIAHVKFMNFAKIT